MPFSRGGRYVAVAEYHGDLGTDTGGANGVGDGIQGQDGRERLVDLIFQFFQALVQLRTGRLLVRDKARCQREQCSFEDRTDE